MGTGQQADCASRIYTQRNQFSRFSLKEIGLLQLVPNAKCICCSVLEYLVSTRTHHLNMVCTRTRCTV